MPAHRIPEGQKNIAQELRELYGGCMTMKDVADELGVKHKNPTKKWLADISATVINGRKRWRVVDVAKKLYESRC